MKMRIRWRGMAPLMAAATTMKTRTLLDNMPNNSGATKSTVRKRSNNQRNRYKRNRKLLRRRPNRVSRRLHSLKLSRSRSSSHRLQLLLLLLLLPLLSLQQPLLRPRQQLLPRSKLNSNHSSQRLLHLLHNQPQRLPLPHSQRRLDYIKVIRRASIIRSIENTIIKSTTSTTTSTIKDTKRKMRKMVLRLLPLLLKSGSCAGAGFFPANLFFRFQKLKINQLFKHSE